MDEKELRDQFGSSGMKFVPKTWKGRLLAGMAALCAAVGAAVVFREMLTYDDGKFVALGRALIVLFYTTVAGYAAQLFFANLVWTRPRWLKKFWK